MQIGVRNKPTNLYQPTYRKRFVNLQFHIHQGSTVQLKYPIRDDLEEAKKTWDYDTNLESEQPWMDTGDGTGDALTNLQIITNSDRQKSAVSKYDIIWLSMLIAL